MFSANLKATTKSNNYRPKLFFTIPLLKIQLLLNRQKKCWAFHQSKKSRTFFFFIHSIPFCIIKTFAIQCQYESAAAATIQSFIHLIHTSTNQCSTQNASRLVEAAAAAARPLLLADLYKSCLVNHVLSISLFLFLSIMISSNHIYDNNDFSLSYVCMFFLVFITMNQVLSLYNNFSESNNLYACRYM